MNDPTTDIDSVYMALPAPPGWEPAPAVLCACGKAEPLDHFDDCFECCVRIALAEPDAFDEDYERGCYDSPDGRRVVSAVASERVRRFGEQVPVYRRTA
jgi:hypothetical protein